MKIGLDLRMLNGGSGISRYIFELSQNILNKDRNNEYVLFFYKLTPDLKNQYGKFGHKMVETNIRHYSAAEQFFLPGILNKESLDLVHFPHFNVPIFYFRPFVVTIHDLTHTIFPGRKKSHFFHRLAYNFVLRSAVTRAKRIIAVSGATKNQVVEYFDVPTDKVEVIYEGANEQYHVLDKAEAFDHVSFKFKIKKPFLLYVGVWRRYKNLPMLARAFDRLREKNFDVELVLAGEPDPFYPEIKTDVLGIKHSGDVRILGRVTDEDLVYLYNAATLFVLPSLMEGFGLTGLEAASCGAPIVCSDIGALREILGSAAEYFDPNNLNNMTDVLSAVLNNPPKQDELANAGLRRSRHFSWKQAGESAVNLYNSVQLK
jgi:glycosyltransferase involved in cell wall biosynthesis